MDDYYFQLYIFYMIRLVGEYIYTVVSLLQSPNLWLIHIMVIIYWEWEKCVKHCLDIPVDSASGHGQKFYGTPTVNFNVK